jgi:hypothetical protein
VVNDGWLSGVWVPDNGIPESSLRYEGQAKSVAEAVTETKALVFYR